MKSELLRILVSTKLSIFIFMKNPKELRFGNHPYFQALTHLFPHEERQVIKFLHLKKYGIIIIINNS